MATSYHHGNLRAAALEQAAAIIAEQGIRAVTMRGLAAELEVSHTALGHVFGSQRGLLVALAADGYRQIGEAMAATDGTLLSFGLAYVEFGIGHPGHVPVMFDRDILDSTDEALARGRSATRAALRAGVEAAIGQEQEQRVAATTLAAWSMMHGLVELDRAGLVEGSGLADPLGGDIRQVADAVAHRLLLEDRP